jgi:hypothetical protein
MTSAGSSLDKILLDAGAAVPHAAGDSIRRRVGKVSTERCIWHRGRVAIYSVLPEAAVVALPAG